MGRDLLYLRSNVLIKTPCRLATQSLHLDTDESVFRLLPWAEETSRLSRLVRHLPPERTFIPVLVVVAWVPRGVTLEDFQPILERNVRSFGLLFNRPLIY